MIGILHIIFGLIRFREDLLAMVMEGLLATGGGEARGWAFWFTFAGVLLFMIGSLISTMEEKNITIPVHLGWVLAIGSIVGLIIFPVSGFWLMLVPSYFIFKSQKAVAVNDA